MNDLEFMLAAINEAKKASGFEKPNPKVGCVIVKENKIISQGFHQTYGEAHAEVNAINKLNKSELEGSTLYVTLEPCSKSGKTPPCTDLIIQSKIKRVVFGSKDPSDNNAKKILEENGIEVLGGVLSEKTDLLVSDFYTNVKGQRPYVIGKVAMTIDGKMATRTNDSKWITSDKAREFSRQRRADVQAILVGSNTIRLDDPQLSVRKEGFKDPKIVVIDSTNLLTGNEKIFDLEVEKIIFSSNEINRPNTKLIKIDDQFTTSKLLDELWSQGIKSLLVEGGSFTLNKFLQEGNLDQLDVYIASKIIGDKEALNAFNFQTINKLSEAKKLNIRRIENITDDIFVEYGVN